MQAKNKYSKFILLSIVSLLSLNAFAQKDSIVTLTTEFGTMKIKLYNETPLHRDNFMKLVRQKFYDSLLFHRVIKEFMIQGGDPDSKRAKAEQMLGNGSPGYTLPAEFNPKYFHKKGSLAAARLGDEMNPKKESSGSQFYIVHGRKFSENDLKLNEERINFQRKQQIYNQYLNQPENANIRNEIVRLQRAQNYDSLNILNAPIIQIVEQLFAKEVPFTYSKEQREAYIQVGGAPHLDGGYTVFGEVIEGLDVIDKIADVEKNQFDRPKKDVRMFIKPEKLKKK